MEISMEALSALAQSDIVADGFAGPEHLSAMGPGINCCQQALAFASIIGLCGSGWPMGNQPCITTGTGVNDWQQLTARSI